MVLHNRAIIKALEPAREPFNVNSLGQLAASAAIKDQEFVEDCKEKNRQGLLSFINFVSRISWSIILHRPILF